MRSPASTSTDSEFFAVHDADLDGVERANLRILERLAVGLREEIEDGGKDPAGQVDLGQAYSRDMHILGHCVQR